MKGAVSWVIGMAVIEGSAGFGGFAGSEAFANFSGSEAELALVPLVVPACDVVVVVDSVGFDLTSSNTWGASSPAVGDVNKNNK